MDLNGAMVFVKVIQAGGFSETTRMMEMPVSTVSAKVATLEKQLEVSLIQRTTRRLRLADSGQIYFKHAIGAIAELQQAATLTQEAQGVVQGRLRITAPVEVGTSSLADSISSFVAKYPGTEVEMILTDRVVDLVGEGVDLGLQTYRLIRNTRLREPRLLKKAPPLRRPQDLENHSCLMFTNIYDGFWTLEKSGVTLKVPVKGGFAANNLVAIHRVAVESRGCCSFTSVSLSERR